jgi:hypothetical protein
MAWRACIVGGIAALGCVAAAVPAVAQSLPPSAHRDVQSGRTHLFEQFYLSGIARLARGDPAGAASVFETTHEIAPDLPQMHYVLALARVLADFGSRAQALPLIDRARTADPKHPLYAILAVLADPALSALKPDGALYVSPGGMARLRDAEAVLTNTHEAYNGKYLLLLFGAIEATGDAAWPQRLPGFAALVGPGCRVHLPHIEEPVSLGRLLALGVPDATLHTYEERFVDRLSRSSERKPEPHHS